MVLKAKRYYVIIFAVIIILSVFSSCGNKKAEDSEPGSTTDTATLTETETERETETESQTATVTAVEPDTGYLSAYKNKLRDILSGKEELIDNQAEEIDNYCFSLIYLDDNDIPELVVSSGNGKFSPAVLFTYNENEVTNQGNYGCFGVFDYMPRTGIFTQYSYGAMNSEEIYYKLENADITQLTVFGRRGDISSEIIHYYIDGNEVTEEEYNSKTDSYDPLNKRTSAPTEPDNLFSDPLPDGVYRLTEDNIINL